MSSPFQVLSPSLKNTRNPFEKLSQPTVKDLSGSPPNSSTSLEEDLEDEALDPNQTLKMFSISQSATTSLSEAANTLGDSGDEGLYEELDQEPAPMTSLNLSDPVSKDILSLDSAKPRLRDALAMSAAHKKPSSIQELLAPESSGSSSKKSKVEFKTSHSAPLDWTLKNSLSITSPDSLSWCDQSSAMDEIEALQYFVSNSGKLSNTNYSVNSAGDIVMSSRTRILSATYHWIYPANTPTITQAQSINKLMNNASNLPSSEKRNISDLFSRSAEWKQSFTALYQSCRNGACPYFYYVGTVWTILFKHGSISTSSEIEAILTNSTPGLREVLEREEIKFERLPNAARKTTVHNFSSKHDLENFEEDDMESISKSTASSLDVHGLFSYLLNLKPSYEDGFLHQSPNLIAGVPFLHAALKRAQISKCRIVSRHIEGTDKMQTEFRVDVQGTLLPMSVKELHEVFAGQQRATGYTCTASSEARSLGMNLRPLLSDQMKSPEIAPFVSPKALDQLRYNHNLKQFSWLP
ncbi:hypothetical protein BGX26_001580 [Mortierella sp. AD094]|nr:hypothetical protein BGX26_001580 [Mortierella sp. AD094]